MSRVKKIKVHREGAGFLLILFAVLFIVNGSLFYFKENKILFYCVFSVSVSIYLIIYNFFRCPPRRFLSDSEGLVIAPADGKIVAIEEVMENEYFHDKRIQVSIFMSVFNVHANWFPVNGTVEHVSHRKGRFQTAYLPKSSTENERSTIVIRMSNGLSVLTRQIAGALARRIVTYAKERDICTIDEQMGFIKFGSRVDTFLPLDTEILVTMKQKVTGNQTPIARLNQGSFDNRDSQANPENPDRG
jgi:phosphatidylserine decarboxylase